MKSDRDRKEGCIMKLWDIAHSRTGDKGNISNVSLIAYDGKDYEMLKEKVTAERVKEPAMKSTSLRMPKSRSDLSCSLR